MRMMDVDSFVRVSVILRDKLIHLDLICNTNQSCLREHFQTTKEMMQFIQDNTEEALRMSVRKIEDCNYILNCEIKTEDGLCSEQKWLKAIGKMIMKFLPIIQKFMVDALTDNLYIIEDGKLVKQ